jgi:hypothetical protein
MVSVHDMRSKSFGEVKFAHTLRRSIFWLWRDTLAWNDSILLHGMKALPVAWA